jgi:bifunctional UDP-N-acetylglucosamine pyrophosphorylase/glucosamine-1-phosphate N-acetyltransferase
MNDTYAVILAAGKGTRMKSKLYKVLHPVCGKPMVQHVVDATKKINPTQTILVVGQGAEQVQEQLGSQFTYIMQEEQLGTGHAVMVTKEELQEKQGTTLILCGDTPLMRAETLEALVSAHDKSKSSVTILTTKMDNPQGYGRIIRNKQGQVLRIVEQKDATVEEQQVQEVNTGVYCFDNQKLVSVLDKITNQNAQGEYYITDCIEILEQQGELVSAFLTHDPEETLGVNDRIALAEAEKLMKKRINQHHMAQGVTIIDPDHTYIGPEVMIGMDTVIHPGTILSGSTQIGEDCVIGPHTELRQSIVGDRSTVQYSMVIESKVGNDTSIGPYAYIRPGSEIGNQCKIGDFVEVKNSKIEDGAKVPHLSYIGDADLGAGVNMGCGSITVNYDGKTKHRTVVEENSFIGCNVNLIAPITVGKGSFIAAGSTINRSTPANSFAIARERQVTKENYTSKLKGKKD